MLAFNDDLLAGDCDYRGMKIVAEIGRQTRAIAASGTVATRASPEPQEGLGHSASVNYRKGDSNA